MPTYTRTWWAPPPASSATRAAPAPRTRGPSRPSRCTRQARSRSLGLGLRWDWGFVCPKERNARRCDLSHTRYISTKYTNDNQAGCMTVCRSAAWKAKMVTSAWWVHASQVRPYAQRITCAFFRGACAICPWIQICTYNRPRINCRSRPPPSHHKSILFPLQ